MIDLVETSELLAFVRTVRASSLSRAAIELGVPRTTVSRRLAKLEERLGVRLLRRTTRSLVLTEHGAKFLVRAETILESVAEAEQSVRAEGDGLRGSLRVSLPPINDPSLNAMIADFARQNPNVQLAVHFSTRHVDLVKDGFDVAIRAGITLEAGLIGRTLTRDAFIAVASPEYLTLRGTPKKTRDLRDHACLLGFSRGEHVQTHWPLANGGQVHVQGSFASNEIALLRDAALSGLGIAMLPMLLVSPFLESGKLVAVLPKLLGAETKVAIVYTERSFASPALRAFIDKAAAWAKLHLPGVASRPPTALLAAARAAPRRKPARARG